MNAGEAEKNVAMDVIGQAFKDLKRRRPYRLDRYKTRQSRTNAVREHLRIRVTAAAFLVSHRSILWFEASGIDSRLCLEKSKWHRHAFSTWNLIMHAQPQLLERAGVRPHHIREIREGLAHFGVTV